jgi:ribosome-binding protein aMBF1 (putative translation factor)
MKAMTDQEALRRLARNLKFLREEAGLSMGALARKIETYPANIKRIEDEENMPGIGLCTRLAEALGVELENLLAKSPEEILSHSA